MVDCRSGHEFKNWSGTLAFRPRRFCKPRNEAAIIDLINEARRTKGCVRTQGAAHSFSQLLATNDTLISLDEMELNSRMDVAPDRTAVTVSAGIRLKDLVRELAGQKLGLKNLGSITEQSFAGAALTGTHGTGITLGAFPTMISAATLVNGKGEIVKLTRSDPELKAVSLSMGALGILTEVTIDCLAHYQIEYNVYVAKFDTVMAHMPELVGENKRVLLWWMVPFFERDDVLVVTKNPPNHPRGLLDGAEARAVELQFTSPLSKAANVHPEQLLFAAPSLSIAQDTALGVLARQGRGTRSGEFRRILHLQGDYQKMLTLPLLPVFHTECEYAIPATNAVAALSELREVVEESDLRLTLPVEVRWTAGDDGLLSPCNNGDICYIGASTQNNTAEVYARFEPIMWKYQGRPHWGKHFTLSPETIRRMYGENFETFVRLRNEMDPDRIFSNSFLSFLLD